MTSRLLIVVLIFTVFACKKENHPPIISNQGFEIQENSPEGTLIGAVIATDPDADKLNYEIITEEDLPLEIDSVSGKLSVKPGKNLDFEAKSKYIFVVKVTDNDHEAMYNLATITVSILDVNEIPQNGLVAYYPFNNSGTDLSPNAYNGIVLGPVIVNDRKESPNSAYSFNGLNDYINLSSLVGNGIRTIAMWFKLDVNVDSSLPYPLTLITREGDYLNIAEYSLAFVPANQGWAGTSGKLRFFYSVNKDWYFYVESDNKSWQKDKWYHVVAMIDPSDGMILYVDNVRQIEHGPFFNSIAESNLNTYLGSWGTISNRFFKGAIDDVLFYNRALSPEEITQIYNQ